MRDRRGWDADMGKTDRKLCAFARRAGAQKRRWFLAAFRARRKTPFHWAASCLSGRLIFLLVLLLSLWALIVTGRNGEWSREEYWPVYPADMLEEGEISETEIFGIRIRFHRGQVMFFREKQQAVRETPEIH